MEYRTIAVRTGTIKRGSPAMPAITRSSRDSKSAVLDSLKDHEYSPIDLLDFLSRETEMTDAQIKDAIWQLFAQMKIEFTSNQTLKLLGRR